MLLFSYGSLILPENLKKFKARVEYSAFLRGYKIITENHSKNSYRHIFLLKSSWDNIVPGFLISMPSSSLDEVDKWEGVKYERRLVTAQLRTFEEIHCFTYMKRQ